MNRPDEAAPFERWLDRELPRAIAAELDASASPPPLTFPSRSLGRRGIVALGHRGAAALAAVALVVAGAGAAVTAGSPNPVSWGHQVVRAVTVGALVLQRTPAPTPDPSPPSRAVTRAAGTDAQPRDAAGDTGAGAQGAGGNQDRAKPGHGGGSSPPDQDRPPKDNGNQQGANKQQ